MFILENFSKQFLNCDEYDYALPLIKHIKERTDALFCKLIDIKYEENEFAGLR